MLQKELTNNSCNNNHETKKGSGRTVQGHLDHVLCALFSSIEIDFVGSLSLRSSWALEVHSSLYLQ